MELITAILIYFGFLTCQQAQVTPMQVNQIIQANQTAVQFYYDNPDELERAKIDRAED